MKRNDPDRLFLFKNPVLAEDDDARGESYLRAATGASEHDQEVDLDFDHFADMDEDSTDDDPPLFV